MKMLQELAWENTFIHRKIPEKAAAFDARDGERAVYRMS